ncbi:nucleoid-associated protein [Aliarcobacter butzleri]|uniref:nucleoid-associated protein n=1 Tax=Aliarcobacter butzleri TaxID=28197 RepID=UPI001EDD9A15|nr:nucleoid-associated protein [Aliarcobacter butzleri]MCG3696610.1 nucleoid-associated protein [Aliarcobacter butzleri]
MDFSEAKIKNLIIHEIGNKVRNEKLFLSSQLQDINEDLEKILLNYFLKSFIMNQELLNFYHNSNLNMNEIYSYSKNIFKENDEISFIKNSKNIAMHLYEFTLHPKITRGELIITEIIDVKYDDKFINLLGIFKSENKDSFLKVIKDLNNINLKEDRGINISKIEKGCLILNTNLDNGFVVLNIDSMSQSTEYWTNKFLNVRVVKNSSYKTKELIKICKIFSDEILSSKYNNEIEFSFNNDYINYFEDNESYDINTFIKSILKNDDIRKEFFSFHENNKESFDVDLSDSFNVSHSDVKKEKKKIKNIIKLDTNLELKVLLNKEDGTKNIEKGFDEEKGMSYYKIYFNEEIN